MSENKLDSNIDDGLGCLFTAIAIAIVLWALSGFPGL